MRLYEYVEAICAIPHRPMEHGSPKIRSLRVHEPLQRTYSSPLGDARRWQGLEVAEIGQLFALFVSFLPER